MFAGLKERLSRRPKEAKPKTIRLGQLQIGINPDEFNPFIHIPNWHAHSLETAMDHGVKPLTYDEIIAQIEESHRRNVVLFDTSPVDGMPGNHFRLVEDQTGQTKLQFCNTFGLLDNRGLLPFSPPEDYAMFTGATILMFQKDGKAVNLGEAQKAYRRRATMCPSSPGEIRSTGELVLWSNAEGKLVAKHGRGFQMPLELQIPQ